MTTTPILAAVRAMHAVEDAAEDNGRDPYDTARVPLEELADSFEGQQYAREAEHHAQLDALEAEGILACYETELAVVEPAPGFLTRRQAG